MVRPRSAVRPFGGVAAGITAEIYGGDFGQGFAQGAWTAGFGFLFNKTAHEIMTGVINGRPILRNTQTGEIRSGSWNDDFYGESRKEFPPGLGDAALEAGVGTGLVIGGLATGNYRAVGIGIPVALMGITRSFVTLGFGVDTSKFPSDWNVFTSAARGAYNALRIK